ncbi:hypothetical protein V2J09_012677 [Rumex salicifolius]
MKSKKPVVRFLSGKTIVPRDGEGEGSTSSLSCHEEFVVDELPRDKLRSSRGSRFNLLANELGLENNRLKLTMSREGLINGIKDLSRASVIDPECR